MPKYIRRSRSSRSRSTDSLRDALLKDLEREGEKLLKKMATQFSRDLEKEGSRMLQGLFSGSGASAGKNGMPMGFEAATSLLSTLITYAISKPKTTTRTRESDRSRTADADFRLSRSQAMAEATAQLAKSERNF